MCSRAVDELLEQVRGSLSLSATEFTALRGIANPSRMVGANEGEEDTMLRLFHGTPPIGREATDLARDDRLLRDTMVFCMAVALGMPHDSSVLHMHHFEPSLLRGSYAVAFGWVCVRCRFQAVACAAPRPQV